MDFTGKKLLILGGASFHIKLVKAAQEMGAYAIVTDNLPYAESPGKQVADEYWDLNIYDIDGIIARMRAENVEAVITGWLDPCQRPYGEICAKMGLPCYGTPEQIFKMTDKHAFKKMCVENGVDIIPEYTMEDAAAGQIEYPVFVKPSDSRGSRGQAVCYNFEELQAAAEFARSESSNGEILIEKYIRGSQEFHVTYFFVNGEPHMLRASDNYCGSEELHMEKVVSCSVIPSRYTGEYLETAHPKVMQMFKNLGMQNGPIFMQGFEDHGVFRFFDPGLRFPGVDLELIFKKIFGIDLIKAMVQIAFTGKCDAVIPDDVFWWGGKRASVLYLTVRAGHLAKVEGIDTVREKPNVISYLPRCKAGDTIKWNYNVNQRLAEIDLLAENMDELKDAIHFIHDTIVAEDDEGNDMIFSRFDTNRIK